MLALLLALVAAIAARLLVGGPLAGLDSDARSQLLELRGLRAASGLVVGASLAIGGVLMQSLLRNPLASPDILGLSAGAGLAVMIAIYLRQTLAGASAPALWGAWQAGPALLGSLGALAIVYSLSQRRGLLDPSALVLIGVVVSMMCGAGILLVQHLMPGGGLAPGAGSRLLIGALSDEVTWLSVGAAALIAAAGLAVGICSGPAMDAATLGDDEAISVGVRLGRLRLILFLLTGVLAASAVVLAGPIGFVGLIAPHAVRLLAGRGLGGATSARFSGHRALVLGAALAGGTLVVAGDAATKALDLGAGRLPLGVVMALIGGASFIVLLRREGSRPV
jgi:iron complex transport system permease protein